VSEVAGQTRFARPDTTPNYAAYRYLDECMAAIDRLKEDAIATDPVWDDTVSLDTLKLRRPLPARVVEYATTCLAKINVDTVTLDNAHKFGEALLVANRDADVERMYRRLADSIATDSTHHHFMMMMNVYMNAIPVRLDRVMTLYEFGLLRLPPDSVTTSLLLRTVVAAVSARSGEQILAQKIAKEMVAIVDTLSPKYRQSPQYQALATDVFYPFLASLMPQQAADSLAVSTEAYRSYLAGLWKSVFGVTPGTEIGPFAMPAPQPTGHFWYSNTGTTGELKTIAPTSPVEKGTVTMIHFLQGGCHSHYQSVIMGRSNGYPSSCWREIHKTRKIMEQYPNIKLVVVSNTFGSFGDAPPLDPQQEADTLANYFLGFHKLKGTHIVYRTDFMRLSKHDTRKVDSDTDNHGAYLFGKYNLVGANSIVFVDELGQIFHFGQNSDMAEYSANIRIRTVMNRAANRLKQ
jgi:hypothetical protein